MSYTKMLGNYLEEVTERPGCPYPHGLPAMEILAMSQFAHWLDARSDTHRAKLQQALEYIRQNIAELGGCDHSVGICMGADIALADSISELLRGEQDEQCQ